MKKLSIIGNLGADAELRVQDGRKFVSLSIADTMRRKSDNGEVYEVTEWISATINGDGGGLLQYLKKGAKVYATGDCTVRTFHSEKQRQLVAGLNLYVRDIELISTNVDDVPRDLYDSTGRAYRISKLYHTQEVKNQELYNRHGEPYMVDNVGYVRRIEANSTDNQVEQKQTTDAPF